MTRGPLTRVGILALLGLILPTGLAGQATPDVRGEHRP